MVLQEGVVDDDSRISHLEVMRYEHSMIISLCISLEVFHSWEFNSDKSHISNYSNGSLIAQPYIGTKICET